MWSKTCPAVVPASLPANDDGSTAAVPLGFTANLFDFAFDEAYVNNNGNITFDGPLGTFTPFDFRETGQPIIAPFFADVDTRGAGSGLVHYGTVATSAARTAFCVNWDNVGYYSAHIDKLNKFQLLLDGSRHRRQSTSSSTTTDHVGDRRRERRRGGLGGTSAAAGYAAGDGDSAHALLLPGSFVNGGLLDTNGAHEPRRALHGGPAGRALCLPAPPGRRRPAAACTGVVTTPDGDEVARAPVQICRQGGECVTRLTSTAGRYTASNLPGGHLRRDRLSGPTLEPHVDHRHEASPSAAPGPSATHDVDARPGADAAAGRHRDHQHRGERRRHPGGLLERSAQADHAGLRGRGRDLPGRAARPGRPQRLAHRGPGRARTRRRSRR